MKRKGFKVALLLLAFGTAVGAWARGGDGLWLAMEPEKTVAYSPETVDPLGPGDDVPFGTLRNPAGKAVDFEGLVRGKLTLILFYQGAWSSFAKAQLEQLTGLVPRLARLGFQVIAISPDQPSRLKETLEADRPNFSLFCDRLMDVTRRFGIAFRVSRQTLLKKGIHLREYTGNSRYILPVPAVYGVDPQGIIRFAFFDARYPLGAEPQKLMEAAGELASE